MESTSRALQIVQNRLVLSNRRFHLRRVGPQYLAFVGTAVSFALFVLFAGGRISAAPAFGQSTSGWPNVRWTAQWISHPTAPQREPGVFHFRKIAQFRKIPEHLVVYVSADNRFLLYVNGKRAGEGPARGDLMHWRYETFDLAPFLREERTFWRRPSGSLAFTRRGLRSPID
jgi:hypothetical protein